MTVFVRFFVLVLSFLVFASCGMPPEDEIGGPTPTEADKTWWRGLSQWQRDRLILERAVRDVDRHVGQECKQWVQLLVVPDASKGVANVPLTCPNAEGWYWCYGRYAVGMSANIRQAQPGWIVQMRRRLGGGGFTPHTAIVYLRTADGIWWLDSNFYSKSAPKTVKLHFETFTDFDRAVCSTGPCQYAVYSIGGG